MRFIPPKRFSEGEAGHIRSARLEGNSINKLALKYSCSVSTVHSIVRDIPIRLNGGGRPSGWAMNGAGKDGIEHSYRYEGLVNTASKLRVSKWSLLRKLKGWGVNLLDGGTAINELRRREELVRARNDLRARRNYGRKIRRKIHADLRVSLKEPMPSLYPFISGEPKKEHDLLVAVHNVVPQGLPKQHREDICQDIIVAILEGKLNLENLKDEVPAFIKQAYKQFPTKYGPLSIDRPISYDDDRLLRDMLSEENIIQHW